MYALRVCIVLLVAFVVLASASRQRDQKGTGPPIPAPAHLCQFGGSLDNEMVQTDDGNSGLIKIPNFPFFGRKYCDLYVNTNGLLSFNQSNSEYTPEWFPDSSGSLIAPYWADATTTLNEGRVYYRSSTMAICINKLSEIVQEAFDNNFKATWIFFVTWHRVTFYGSGDRPPRNTFQAVLVTDGTQSYVVFNYGDIAWTTGSSSDGDDNGLGGTPAGVGFNAGDGTRYYTQFTSLTPDVIDIRTKTNCNQRGRFVFRVDGREILSPPPTPYGYLMSNAPTLPGMAIRRASKKKPASPIRRFL